MCYVERGKPDIFVSYAHVDNEPEPYEGEGRVTTFVRFLTNYLARKLGKRDAFDLKFDFQMPSALRLNPALEAMVRDSAVLVVVHSEGFLRSD
jgi:hypothetical protein